MTRRQFIERVVAAGAVFSASANWYCTKPVQAIPKRPLGLTGEKLSVVGFGGIIVRDEEQSIANNRVAQAFDSGVNYFDVAPSYGNAEEKLGPALKPYRHNSFLACKTGQRSAVGAEKELHESLQKMQTDHFDLYQLHHLTTDEDIEKAFGPGGAMELFVKAKQEGKIRHLGFSAHSEKAALAAMDLYDFDSILFPINYVTWFSGEFGERVVQKAIEKEMGILALKGMAHRRREKDDEKKYDKTWYHPIDPDNLELIDKAMRFTWSKNVTAAIPPGEPIFFPLALKLAENITDIAEKEIIELQTNAQGVQPIFSSIES